MKRRAVWAVAGLVVVAGVGASAAAVRCEATEAFCFSRSGHRAADTIQTVDTPRIAVPAWKVGQ